MKNTIKLILAVVVLSSLIVGIRAYFYPKAEIKVVTDITSVQADAIQKEFGFTLAEGYSLALCKLANSRDRLFTVVITGTIDEEEFIMNNLEFEVEEPYQREHHPYDPSKTDELYNGNEEIMANYYFGIFNGSKREILYYTTGYQTVLEIKKGGVVSHDLLEEFHLIG